MYQSWRRYRYGNLRTGAGFVVPAGGGGGGQAFFNSQGNYNSGTASSIAVVMAATSGNLIVVAGNWAAVGTTGSIADDASNSYTSIIGPTDIGGGLASFFSQLWYAKNVTGGTLTITLTLSGPASGLRLAAHAYSGFSPTTPLDQFTEAGGHAGGSPISSGNVTTTAANELIFGWGVSAGGTTAGSGFTQREIVGSESTEDKFVTSTGSYDASFASSGTDWLVQMATFK